MPLLSLIAWKGRHIKGQSTDIQIGPADLKILILPIVVDDDVLKNGGKAAQSPYKKNQGSLGWEPQVAAQG